MIKYTWWGGNNSPPENLKTRKQLSALGYAPVKAVGVIETPKYDCYLYDLSDDQSVRKKKPASDYQLKNLEKGRKLQEIRAWLDWQQVGHFECHNDAVNWARNVLESKEDYVVLDTETTGLSSNSEAIQIAVCDLNGTELFNSLVKPTIPISASAINIHGITDDVVKSAPTFEQVYDDLRKCIDSKEVVIYNASYDVRVLANCCRSAKLPFLGLKDRACCAMLWYAQYVGEWHDYYESYIWQKLPGGDHTALGDCRAVLGIIKEMAESDLISTNPEDYLESW